MTKVFHYLVLIETPKKANSLSIILRAVDIVFISSYFMFKNLNLYLCIVFLIIRQFYYCVSSIWILDIKPKELVPKFDKELFKYLRYGFIPMLTILMMTINYKIDTIMLSHSKNVSIAEIGVYALGVSLAEHVWIIPDALKDILLSKLTNGKGEEEVAKICRISLIIILLCILGVAIVGKPIIHIIYGNQYSDAYQVMILITMGGIGMIFYKMIYSYNVINGRRLVNLFLLSSAAIINIVLNAFLIPNHGIIGAAIASLVSYLICGLMFLRYFVKLTNYPWKRIVLVQYEDIIAFIPDKLMKYWNKRCNNIK
jgi:O-antigen/teichoic acid export membrane protein